MLSRAGLTEEYRALRARSRVGDEEVAVAILFVSPVGQVLRHRGREGAIDF